MIDVEHLPHEVVHPGFQKKTNGVMRSLAEVEREHILAVLAASGGNKAKAAGVLGIGSATLFRKLREYRGEDATASEE